MTTSRTVVLASRPAGVPQSFNFAIAERPLVAPTAGKVQVRNLYLSVEPAMRGWVSATANYSDPVAIGDVMRSLAVGQVTDTGHPDFQVGDLLLGWFGWQEWATVDAAQVVRRIRETDLPSSLALGVLGLNGVTAWLALDTIGHPGVGQTIVVSTAAGSVGSAAGQLAKVKGARTIGIAGGPEKVAQCLDLFGFDAAIDYRNEDVGTRLAEVAPEGVDIYFDNTAGPISDAVVPHLNVAARVIVCGTASVAKWDPAPLGPRVERHLLTKRATMTGFLFFDHLDRLEEAVADLAAHVRAGSVVYREDLLDGIDQCADAIAGLYRGENMGKRIIRLPADKEQQ